MMLSYCSNVVAADNLDVLERHVLSVFAPARERRINDSESGCGCRVAPWVS